MGTKLERLMNQRAETERKVEAAARKSMEDADEKRERANRLWAHKEFDRLFKRLKGLVEGNWDRYGWGWKFQYKGADYWISYDSWHYEKTPGDVDDYSSSGWHWVLKPNFNSSGGQCYTLTGKVDMTEKVLQGLKELTNPKGHRW